MVKLLAGHFEDQAESFVFPKLLVCATREETEILEMEGGAVIFDDFQKYWRNELKAMELVKQNTERAKLMDTTELDRKFGKEDKVMPTLANLCIRNLHKEGAPFAKGQTDGDAIIQNAMEENYEKEEQ